MRRFALLPLVLLGAGVILLSSGCLQDQNNTPASPPESPGAVPSDNNTSQESLVSFVKEAVAYAKANDREKVLAEFSNPNGSFVRCELYIYAYDFNGTTLAHPFNPEKIGVNRLYEPDAHGGLFIKNLRDMAKNESGFVSFYYINPAHNRTVESKLGYVEKVDDDWWLGSGIYSGT
jgi:signal transduction histidine kinase